MNFQPHQEERELPTTISIPVVKRSLSSSHSKMPTTPDRTITSFETVESFQSFGDYQGNITMEEDKKDVGRFLPTVPSQDYEDLDQDDVPGDDDDDVSVPSMAMEVEKLSRLELMDLVERLYQNMKRADAAFANEQSRRHKREKSLIKLARELKLCKERLAECMEQIEEVRLPLPLRWLQDNLALRKSQQFLLCCVTCSIINFL
jgi:hypothetical protein